MVRLSYGYKYRVERLYDSSSNILVRYSSWIFNRGDSSVSFFRVFWGGSVAVLVAVRPASRSGLSPERSSSPGESPDEAGGSGLSGEEGS